MEQLRTRGIMRQQMLSKSLDILQQFGREIDTISSVFNLHKVSTKLNKSVLAAKRLLPLFQL